MDKKFLQIVKELSVLVGIGTLSIIILNYSTDIFKGPKVVEREIEVVKEVIIPSSPSEYPDFNYFKDLKKVELAYDIDSWVEESSGDLNIQGRKIVKFIKIDGEISNAFLYLNLSVDNGKPLTSWDSIYVSLRKNLNGHLYFPYDGHLLRSRSLSVPNSDTTTMLFDLRQIPLTSIPYSEKNDYVVKDWLSIIKDSDTFQFETFLSTLRSGGKINEISIGYECSPATPNCKLEIID
jgi:hypothetical protein